MEALTLAWVSEIAKQGMGWLLACLLAWAYWRLYGRLEDARKLYADGEDKLRAEWDIREKGYLAAIAALNEKRMEEMRRSMEVANNSTLASATLADSLKDRTALLDKIAQAVDMISQDAKSARDRWGDRATALENRLSDILRTCQDLMARFQEAIGRARP